MNRKVVAVVGAAGGIGQAVSNRFKSDTAKFARYLILLDKEGLPDYTIVDRIRACCQDPSVTFGNKIDVQNTWALGQCFRGIIEVLGRVDVLVNAFGVLPPPSPFIKTDEETIDMTLAVNLRGTINCCKAVLPIMRKQGYGRIVNISSVSAQVADPGNTIYAVSKAAVEKLTTQLAIEAVYCKESETPPDITVNAVAPGIVDTPMTRHITDEAIIRRYNPLSWRKIRPDEVAEKIYHLVVSPEKPNGQIVTII